MVNFVFTSTDLLLRIIITLEKSIYREFDSIQFDKTTPTAMSEHIRYNLGYDRILKKMNKKLGYNYDNLLDIVEVLGLIARHMPTMTEFAGRLKQLEILARSSHIKNECAITLTTSHSSKGLKIDRVYLIDFIELCYIVGLLKSHSLFF